MELMMTGVGFMIIGMTMVFVFLIIMIFSMNILRIVVGVMNKYFPEKEDAAVKPSKVAAKADNSAIAAAIAASYAADKK